MLEWGGCLVVVVVMVFFGLILSSASHTSKLQGLCEDAEVVDCLFEVKER